MEVFDISEYVLSLSYGKDSLACIGAIKALGWKLDRIIHAEVWATDTIPADLPPMVEFKSKADKIIKEMTGIEVEHLCAVRNGEKLTYEKLFYHIPNRKPKNQHLRGDCWIPVPSEAVVQRTTQNASPADSRSQSAVGARNSKMGAISGFPISVNRGNWCTSLKQRVFPKLHCTRSENKYCAVPRYSG